MYIPFLSKRQSARPTRPAATGGSGGGTTGRATGGSGATATGGGSGTTGTRAPAGATGTSGSTRTGSRPSSTSTGRAAPPRPSSASGGTAVHGSSSSSGGGKPYTISSGAFIGRRAGGGRRTQVYGRGGRYGNSRGRALVGGAALPFIYWPLTFGGAPHYYGSGIYDTPDNSSRPGGPLITYTLLPTWSSPLVNGTRAPAGNAFALYGDTNSVLGMVDALEVSGCGVAVDTAGADYTTTINGVPNSVSPQSVVQYYRDSTFALLLDGYNSTLPDVEDDAGTAADDLPDVDVAPVGSVAGLNGTYFDCLNATIGDKVQLINADDVNAAAMGRAVGMGVLTVPAMLVGWFLLGV